MKTTAVMTSIALVAVALAPLAMAQENLSRTFYHTNPATVVWEGGVGVYDPSPEEDHCGPALLGLRLVRDAPFYYDRLQYSAPSEHPDLGPDGIHVGAPDPSNCFPDGEPTGNNVGAGVSGVHVGYNVFLSAILADGYLANPATSFWNLRFCDFDGAMIPGDVLLSEDPELGTPGTGVGSKGYTGASCEGAENTSEFITSVSDGSAGTGFDAPWGSDLSTGREGVMVSCAGFAGTDVGTFGTFATPASHDWAPVWNANGEGLEWGTNAGNLYDLSGDNGC